VRAARRSLALTAAFALWFAPTACLAQPPELAPEFTHAAASERINSPPLAMAQLRGKVVMLEFWTFECVNCLRTLPWLKDAYERYRDRGLVLVAVHTPEFAHEREPRNVKAAVERLGITYPVMLDTDFSYWRALENRYWPAFYLVDRDGTVRAQAIGELHAGQARAREFERHLEQALSDSDADADRRTKSLTSH